MHCVLNSPVGEVATPMRFRTKSLTYRVHAYNVPDAYNLELAKKQYIEYLYNVLHRER
jgi:hypothetical protein